MGHVVGASHDDHSLGMEVDDVGLKPHQHLRRGLATDASTAIVVAAEEIGMEISPVVGDGVAHKDHIGIIPTGDNTLIVGLIAIEAEPILRIAEE